MQKVITITSSTGIANNDAFVETEYPDLNQYLSDGYIVREIIPIIKSEDNSDTYAVVFVLEADE